MAITIEQSPQAGAAITSPLIHQVSSTNVAQTDFRYLFDIYVNSALILRAKVIPDPNGVLEVSRIVRNYAAINFLPNVANLPLSQEYTPSVEYTVQYGEEYRTGGITTQYLNLDDSTHTVWNTYGPLFPVTDNDLPLSGREGTWITDRDLNRVEIPNDGPAFLTFYGPADDYGIAIELLDADGVPDANSSTQTGAPLTFSHSHTVLDISREAMNLANWGGGPAPIPTSAPGYRFQIINTTTSDASAWVYVFFGCDGLPVHFLNRYGGFDTYHFTAVNRREINVDRQSYRTRGLQVVSGNWQEYDGNRSLYAEHERHFSTRLTGGWKLRSGWLTDQHHEWLAQLVASPITCVFYNGAHVPVTIRTNRWSERLTRFDKVYDLELDVILQREGRAQYR